MKRDKFGRELRKLVGPVSTDIVLNLYYKFIECEKTLFEFVQQIGEDYGWQISSFHKGKPISNFSSRRKQIETSYKKMLSKKTEETHDRICCQGCGTCMGRIDPSHLVPRSERVDLIDDEENVHWHCRERCHALVESGRYDELLDGAEIVEYIKRVAPDYLIRQLQNRIKNEKNN